MGKYSYIYALCEPSNGAIRYIGQSVNPESRLMNHVATRNACIRSTKARWIRRLYERNEVPKLKVLEKVDKHNVYQREYAWIKWYINLGYVLFNDLSTIPKMGATK